jgi:hypothetical protein
MILISIRTQYSRHILAAHFQGFNPLTFGQFLRLALQVK